MAETILEGSITYEGIQQVISQIHVGVMEAMQGMVRKAAQDILHDILEQEYPSGIYSEYYTTTGEMADTVQVTDVQMGTSVASFAVYIDSTRLNMTFNPHMLNAHADIHGDDFREGLVHVLDTGAFGSPIYNNPGSHYMDRAGQEMESKLPEMLAQGLRAQGFEVMVG